MSRTALPLVKYAVVIIMLLTIILVGSNAGISEERMLEHREYREKARAYCYQWYDDPRTGIAQVFGEHGGLHCIANNDDPHLHEVTDEALEAAYRANQTNATAQMVADRRDEFDRFEAPRNRPGIFPVPLYTVIFVGISVVIVGGLIAIIAGRRSGES